MGFPIDISDIKDCINIEKFCPTLYRDKNYYLAKWNFSLIATIEDFVLVCENGSNNFVIKNRMLWLEFLQVYYQKMNQSRNILKSLLKTGVIEENDILFINDTLQWSLEILKSIFNDDSNNVYYANIIFSGRFYCSIYYYTQSIDSFCEKKLNLVQEYIHNLRELKILEKERFMVDQLHNDITNLKLENITQFEPDLYEKLMTMWNRTLDFIDDILLPRFSDL